MTKQELLKTHFGYDTFREGQEAVIDALLEGKDVLAVMPTGAGKSICYQVPALMMKGITLVISPLISLMKDQVRSLNQAGISAAYLNSSLTQGQYFTALRYAKAGRYPIIYVAPERLTTEAFLDFALSADISMIAVDESHCVSQWGQDFRPSYLKIAEFVAQLPKRPVISAFTATATKEVREDIARLLGLQDPFCTTTGFDRENLYFAVKTPKDKYKEVHDYILEHPDDSGIIYCLTRKLVEEVCGKLIRDGITATRYHAGLSDEERRNNQDDFIYDLADDGANNEYVQSVREYSKKDNCEVFVICAQIEQEISELDDDEKKMFLEDLGISSSGLDKLIAASYRILGLISYLTAGETETRAWTITNGTKAPGAAGKIHSDFERGFIKAEVVNYKDLLDCGSYTKAKEKGLVRMEGKDYVVKDGDVILFRFNV